VATPPEQPPALAPEPRPELESPHSIHPELADAAHNSLESRRNQFSPKEEQHPLMLPEDDAQRPSRPSFRAINESFRVGDWTELAKRDVAFLYVIRAFVQTIRQVNRDALFARASSLAFFTVLSLVPLFIVVGSLFLIIGDNPATLVDDIQEYLMPVAGTKITDYIVEAVQRAADSSLGPIGAMALIVTSVALFLQIERVINEIWRVQRRRPFWVRVLVFYSMLTIGPILLSFSIFQAARLSATMSEYGVAGFLVEQSVVLIVSSSLFALGFALLPNTRVSWKAALAAGLTTAALFELAKRAFQLYVSNVFAPGYAAIYGAIGLIPVFLLWVYLSWFVVLFGAELAYCLQNLRWLMVEDKVTRKLERNTRECHVGSSLLALEIFAAVVRGFARGEVPVPLELIGAQSGYALTVVNEVMGRLERERIVIKVDSGERDGYMPARPLEQIRLLELLELFEVHPDKAELTPALRRLLQRHHRARERALGEMTAEALARDVGTREPSGTGRA
jgi:membrane protein